MVRSGFQLAPCWLPMTWCDCVLWPAAGTSATGTSKGTWHQIKIREKKGYIELSMCVRLMSVAFARQNSENDHMRRPCTKKDAPAEKHGIWRNIFTSSRMRTMLRFTRVMPAPTSKGQEEREFVVDSGKPMHMLSKKDLSSDELDTLPRSRNSTYSQWGSAYKRGSTSIRSRSKSLRDCPVARRHACCPVAWKTLRRPRIVL